MLRSDSPSPVQPCLLWGAQSPLVSQRLPAFYMLVHTHVGSKRRRGICVHPVSIRRNWQGAKTKASPGIQLRSSPGVPSREVAAVIILTSSHG